MPDFLCSLIATASITNEFAAQSVGLHIMSLIRDTALSVVGSMTLARGGLQPAESRLACAIDDLIKQRMELVSKKRTTV